MSRRIEVEPHVHLDAADGGQIVTLRIEEQRLEHVLRRVDGRWLARTHDAVDVEQRVLARHVLVDRQRVADIGADIDVIDVEKRQLFIARLVEDFQRLVGDLLAGLGVDLAGLGIDQVLGDVLADQLLVGQPQRLEALLGKLPGLAHGELLAGFEHDLAGIGVDQIVDRLVAAQPVGIERHAPAVLGALVLDLLIEGVEDFLAAHTERVEQRRDGNLAPAIDARIDDVLGVELDVEPGAAIGDDAGCEQELARGMRLALVVIEKHAGRAMHLRNDDALGAVDDEGAVIGHERNVAHVDILLFDVLHRTGAGLLVDIEHDQTQRHFERRSVGHAALAALVDVVFRRLEFVFDEFQLRGVGKVGNREHRLEDRLQTLVGPAALRLRHQQELVVGRLLNLNEVRHLRDFLDFSEKFPYALPTDKRLRHHVLSLNRTIGIEPPAAAPSAQTSHSHRRAKSPGGRGTEAIKTTLQRAAIHRDRRDRRHTPYFAPHFPAIRSKFRNRQELRTSLTFGVPGPGSARPGISVK